MDIDVILQRLKSEPQTYNTFLDEIWCGSPTKRRTLRRKLNRLCNEGYVCRALISLQKILFYHPEKDYTLFFMQKGLHVEAYYCKEYTEDALFVYLKAPYKLCETTWEQIGKITLDKENLLKVA